MSIILPLAILAFVAVLIHLAARLRETREELDRLSYRFSTLERALSELQQEANQLKTREAQANVVEPSPLHARSVDAPFATHEVPEPQHALAMPPPIPPPLPATAWSDGAARAAGEKPEGFACPSASHTLPPASAAPAWKPPLRIDWEQFMGVKLFAWLGGFALFLGVAFFIKYSFERNLIPPALRATIGFLVGGGLVAAGVVMKRRALAVTAQTLCATGIVILYTVTFACRSVYHFPLFGQGLTFLLMVIITAGAFSLAVRMEAVVVAILGLLGGFLTPLLLSTGQNNPTALFTYIALLDAGLLAVSFRRRWHFLIPMAAAGTVLLQWGWLHEYFTLDQIGTARVVWLGFDLLFLLGFVAGEKLAQHNRWSTGSAAALPFLTFAFVVYLMSDPLILQQPSTLFSFVLPADLCLLAMVVVRPGLAKLHLAAGTTVFLLLGLWMTTALEPALLYWALGLSLGFATLHTIFPIALAQYKPAARQAWWGHAFPPLALLLAFIPLLKLEPVSLVLWPVVLLLDLLAIMLALLTASIASILLVLALTLGLTAVWILKLPTDLSSLGGILSVIGGFALFFFTAGAVVGRKLLVKISQGTAGRLAVDEQLAAALGLKLTPGEWAAQVPAVSAILPFLLLMMVTTRLPLPDPSPVFGLALLLIGLLLGTAIWTRIDVLLAIGLASVLALQMQWHQAHFNAETRWTALTWHIIFYAVFTAFPFVTRHRWRDRWLPWAVAALAGPLHFYLIHRSASFSFLTGLPGLLPLLFAFPMLLAVRFAASHWNEDLGMRTRLLAWFGGSALFFVTLSFPLQFERQWITLGWALEGLALIWLFHRVPHPGLRATGAVLLMLAFVRLGLNPAVLAYPRTGATPIFNWYFYSYGLVTLCLFGGAHLLAPPRHLIWKKNFPPVLYTLGTILAFLLVNIEIADYFGEGTRLRFQFTGNFARDMSYSIAWGLFALALLIVGIWRELRAPRYAAIGLLSITLLKLFLHDLNRLGQLHRIGAFLGVAVILIFASYLYQRFVSFEVKERNSGAEG